MLIVEKGDACDLGLGLFVSEYVPGLQWELSDIWVLNSDKSDRIASQMYSI